MTNYLITLAAVMSAVADFAAVHILFPARRDRLTNPAGHFDRSGRWYPSDAEDADGYTRHIRTPSRAWPYSYMTAARTRKHCRALAEVAPTYVLAQATAALEMLERADTLHTAA